MVFFQQQLQHTVVLHPEFLGPQVRDKIKEALLAQVEGMAVGDKGYLVSVLSIDEGGLSKGLIEHLTGHVKYVVSYKALMFRPFKNEVMDVVVHSVTPIGLFGSAGPLDALISKVHIPPDLEFNAEDTSYTSIERGIKIRVGSAVRVKVIGASVLQSSMCAIGSINEPFLGLLA